MERDRAADTAILPLSPVQQVIRSGRLLAGGQPIHNMAWRFDLSLDLNPDRFRAAFDKVVAAREGARLVIDGDHQRILNRPPCHPDPVDLSQAPDPDAALGERIAARMAVPVDPERQPWISQLFRLGDGHWVWVLCQDHVFTDAVSGATFFDLVSRAYEGRGLGQATPLSDLVQRRPDPETLAHWAQKSGTRPPAPYGGRRDPENAASVREVRDLGADRTAALDGLARSTRFAALGADLSAFLLLATIHAAWLNRATGQAEVSFAAPAHMRSLPRDRLALGPFMEQLPLHVTMDGSDSFATLHAKLRSEAMEWLRHAQSGVSTHDMARGITGLFNYLPIRFGAFAGAPARAEWLHSGFYDANHDLVLTISRFDGASYQVDARLNTAVFGDHANRMMSHWLTLMDACLEDPDAIIATVPFGGAPLVGPKEPPAATVLEAFAARVAETPEAIAVQQGARTLSYAAFDRMVSSYAAGYGAAGARAGDPVLIHARRSIETVAAIWGAMRAGVAFVPMVADAPTARVRDVVERHSISCAVLDDQTRGRVPLTEVQPLEPPGAWPEVARDAVAYAMFTSGSTGTPKGVAVDHDGLARYVAWAAREHPGDYALCSSLGFDLTITSLMVPLVSGHRIRIYPDVASPDLAVLEAVRDDAVDVIKLTPAHLSLVLARPCTVTRISTLILGGSALSTDLARRASALSARGVTIANEYGPTEAVVGAMLERFVPGQGDDATVSIGRPGDGVTITVADPAGHPLPPGMIGEIRIGGRLARGYLGDPELTAARFVGNGGQRAYLTGDLARIEVDGRISCLGRGDDQIKVNGVRIEPVEIEAALLAQPGVRAAHVGLWTPPAYDARASSCTRCGLSIQVPGTSFDGEGVCSTCRRFEAYRDRADAYFETPEVLRSKLDTYRRRRAGRYDAIMLLSGGKDSTYALYRLAELTPDILCLTLDNGFISDEAKVNIRAVADELGLEHRMMTTPAMPAIFRDSLQRFSNVCQGCFKTIYTLALRVAREEHVPAIVTGLSRGQFFETRLTPELFEHSAPTRAQIEDLVLEARKSYHQVDDAVARHLDTRDLADPGIFDEIEFLDIYRYIDVPVEEIYSRLSRSVWRRPSDTGRSTNCRINDLGIHVHTRVEGFHNYAIPYAWDVRMGHKTRAEAMGELQDDIQPGKLGQMMEEIGLHADEIDPKPQLAAWVVGDGIDPFALRDALRGGLPREMVPARIAVVDDIPLSINGKVDAQALPPPPMATSDGHGAEPPATETEERLAQIFQDILGLVLVGVTDNFYDIGGDSLSAIRIAVAAEERGIKLAPADLFQNQTIRTLAAFVDTRAPAQESPQSADPLVMLDADDLAAIAGLGRG